MPEQSVLGAKLDQKEISRGGISGLSIPDSFMSRKYWNTIYIDRNPDNPYEGWGWVEVTTEDTEHFGVPTKSPDT